MNTINLKGHIPKKQNITGTVKVSDSINGTVGDVVCINGTISRQTKRLSGTVKNPSHIHGIISKPSGRGGQSDHVFVIVDLIKFHEQQLIVNSGIGLAFPSTTVSVNSMTANNIAFSNGNIIVNKEVLSDATA